jgi:transposase
MSSLVAFAPPATPSPVVLKLIDPDEGRRERGRAIAAVCRIEERKPGLWIVPAQTGGGSYWVRMVDSPPTCTCEDFAKRERDCKHIHAVRLRIEQRAAPGDAEPMASPEAPDGLEPLTIRKPMVAPRPTYRQDWPSYNRAQIHEKAKFLTLLTELCRGVPEPPKDPERVKKGGRPPVPMADRAFACALKVFSGSSGRRASTDMRDAKDRGHLSHAPHDSAVFRYLEDAAMTPSLMGLIAESALPLRSIESDFVVDSTGFATSRFVRWFDHKYGVVRRKYDWVKAHLMTGVKTNVVTAVAIAGRGAHDSPQFKPLFQATVGSGFRIREVSADAAYLSHENMNMVGDAGGAPFLGFKSNTTAAGGGLMAKMFHLDNLNRDEYLAHYHKRSNVESTNMMIKSKFGDHVRSKTEVAMANEALCKVLCHDLCCLIQSTYELGVEATFWGDESVEPQPAASAFAPEASDFAALIAWM